MFAAAVDWPGWCRRGRGEQAALQALADYAPRFRRVAGSGFRADPLQVIGAVPGSTTTDYGAPDGRGPWDEGPLDAKERQRLVRILRRCWDAFDEAAEDAPTKLPKGPRGGGRDRQGIVDHVREAERAYASRMGLRIAPRTPWKTQRDTLADHLLRSDATAKWPLRYGIRRTAWHVLDHAWELEDKT